MALRSLAALCLAGSGVLVQYLLPRVPFVEESFEQEFSTGPVFCPAALCPSCRLEVEAGILPHRRAIFRVVI